MRTTFAAAAAVLILTFAAGCGTSGGDDDAEADGPSSEETTTTGDNGDTIDVETWAEGFCGDFSDWVDEIRTASGAVSEDIEPGDADGAKQVIVDLFGTASTVTQAFIDDLEARGAPDIDDGEGLVELLVDRFEDFDQAALDAQVEAEALTTDDPSAFQDEADALVERFEDQVATVGDSFGAIDDEYPDQELQVALTAACDF